MVGIDTNMIKLVFLYKKQEQEQFESIEEIFSLKKLEKENLPVPLDTPIKGANSCGLSVNMAACLTNASCIASKPFKITITVEPQYKR